jgi:hypothetical protein
MIAEITRKLRMMKKYILQWLILPILLTSCGTFPPPPTATSAPTFTPAPPTATVLPTETPAPTLTLTQTATIWPTPNSDQIAVLERLRMVYVKEGNLYVQDGVNPPRQLTYDGQNISFASNVSDDGEKIVFFKGQNSENLYSINGDGTQELLLLNGSILASLNLGYPKEFKPEVPVFVSNTHQIVFVTAWSNDLLLVDTDTAKIEIKRSAKPDKVEHFLVSPDGKLVAIQSPSQVKVVDLAGRIVHNALITYTYPPDFGFYPVDLHWTSDSSILFALPPREWNSSIYENPAPRTIWKCPLNGGSPIELQLVPPPLDDDYAISSDGKWIVYFYYPYSSLPDTDLAVTAGIYLGNLQDGTTKLMTSEAENGQFFQWSPDNIHFTFNQNGNQQILGNINGELTLRKEVWNFYGWVDASHYLFGNIELGEINRETILKLSEGGIPSFVLLKSSTEK